MNMSDKVKTPREIMMRAISGPTRFRAVLEGYGVVVEEIERELAANGWEIARKKPTKYREKTVRICDGHGGWVDLDKTVKRRIPDNMPLRAGTASSDPEEMMAIARETYFYLCAECAAKYDEGHLA